jgi:hypothetical protein
MARLQSLDLDKKFGLDNLTPAKAEEALELTDFVLVMISQSFKNNYFRLKSMHRGYASS